MANPGRKIDDDFGPVVAQAFLNLACTVDPVQWIDLYFTVTLPRLADKVNADYDAWVAEQAAIQTAKEELS